MLNRLLATLLCLTLPAIAAAQSAPAPKVDPGQRVWLTMTNGVTIPGRVVHVTDTDIQITTEAGDMAFPLSTIRRIEKPDPIWNGALIGAGTFVAAAVIGQTAGFGGGACRFVTASDGPRCVEAAPVSKASRTATVVVTLGLFAAGGALIDFLRPGHDLVWEQPAKVTVSISPAATLHSIGFNGLVRW